MDPSDPRSAATAEAEAAALRPSVYSLQRYGINLILLPAWLPRTTGPTRERDEGGREGDGKNVLGILAGKAITRLSN